MKIKLYQCGEKCSLSEYPLGLGYLKSNAPAGVDVEIVKRRYDLTDCDLIGLSSNADGLREALGILEESKISVVIGGQGTLWEGLQRYPFQAIVIGEGEKVWATDCVRKVHRPSPIEDIDSIHPPERGSCGKVVPILTSRGCPFSCRFCSARAFWGKVRYHSAEYVIDEVEYILSRYPRVEILRIMDDLFIGDKSRLNRISKLWRWKSRFRLRGFVRSTLMTEEVARRMREIGFHRVRFGAESGSNRILQLLGKRATVADHERAIKTARKAGLQVRCSFMMGIPGETIEDRRATLRFIRRNKVKVEGWYRWRPFPGTDMWKGENPLLTDMRVRR